MRYDAFELQGVTFRFKKSKSGLPSLGRMAKIARLGIRETLEENFTEEKMMEFLSGSGFREFEKNWNRFIRLAVYRLPFSWLFWRRLSLNNLDTEAMAKIVASFFGSGRVAAPSAPGESSSSSPSSTTESVPLSQSQESSSQTK